MTEDFSNVIHKSLDSVLEVLKRDENRHLGPVRKLMQIYNEVRTEYNVQLEAGKLEKKYPLIVLEGLDGCGKSTATKRLSKRLDAELFCTPPPCLREIRSDFDGDNFKDLRAVYYELGNYIAGMQMAKILTEKSIVLDRFWHSTVAYAIAQAIADYPDKYKCLPSDPNFYNWPEDLYKPDLVVFLCVNEEVRLQRIRNRTEFTTQEKMLKDMPEFRANVVKVYNRMTNPKLQFVNGQLSKRKTEDAIVALLPQPYKEMYKN